MKKMSTIYIGHVVLPKLTFQSEFTISRKNPEDVITHLNERYVRVNTEENCYVKEAQYNELFGDTPSFFSKWDNLIKQIK
jgi:hypothetical protein